MSIRKTGTASAVFCLRFFVSDFLSQIYCPGFIVPDLLLQFFVSCFYVSDVETERSIFLCFAASVPGVEICLG